MLAASASSDPVLLELLSVALVAFAIVSMIASDAHYSMLVVCRWNSATDRSLLSVEQEASCWVMNHVVRKDSKCTIM